jgi:hypothetical protein
MVTRTSTNRRLERLVGMPTCPLDAKAFPAPVALAAMVAVLPSQPRNPWMGTATFRADETVSGQNKQSYQGIHNLEGAPSS